MSPEEKVVLLSVSGIGVCKQAEYICHLEAMLAAFVSRRGVS